MPRGSRPAGRYGVRWRAGWAGSGAGWRAGSGVGGAGVPANVSSEMFASFGKASCDVNIKKGAKIWRKRRGVWRKREGVWRKNDSLAKIQHLWRKSETGWRKRKKIIGTLLVWCGLLYRRGQGSDRLVHSGRRGASGAGAPLVPRLLGGTLGRPRRGRWCVTSPSGQGRTSTLPSTCARARRASGGRLSTAGHAASSIHCLSPHGGAG